MHSIFEDMVIKTCLSRTLENRHGERKAKENGHSVPIALENRHAEISSLEKRHCEPRA